MKAVCSYGLGSASEMLRNFSSRASWNGNRAYRELTIGQTMLDAARHVSESRLTCARARRYILIYGYYQKEQP